MRPLPSPNRILYFTRRQLQFPTSNQTQQKLSHAPYGVREGVECTKQPSLTARNDLTRCFRELEALSHQHKKRREIAMYHRYIPGVAFHTPAATVV